jgi:glucose/arabinose dehydrogenase
MKRSNTPAPPWALVAGLLAACGGDTGTGGGDTTAPSVTLTSPAAFAENLSGQLTLTAAASDNVGVASVEYQIDGRPLAGTSTGPSYAVPLQTGDHASGQHVVRVRARDAAGNVSAWSSSIVRFGGSVAIGSGFTLTGNWVVGLTNATAMVQAPDGRWLVAEQGGTVRVVTSNATLIATPFLQLPGVDSTDERGLIGLTLHPNFASNGLVYAHYTTNVARVHNRVSRFQAVPPSSNTASPGSEAFILDDLPTLNATNHNGGAIRFGTDGMLYVGVGENAVGANAQNPDSPLGKLLRLNADGSIPSDNPFFQTRTGLARAIWASGLRNPFTFAVQPETGRIHINDVGEGTWEEINLGAAGANYGWPGSEGPDHLGSGIAAPLFAYRHTATPAPGTGPGGFFVGRSIAGGAFYPTSGPFPAELRGNYFFADFVSRFVGVIDLANGNSAYAFAHLAGQPVDMQVGLDGALYVLTRNAIARISAP